MSTLSKLTLTRSVNPRILAAVGTLGVIIGVWFIIDGPVVAGAFFIVSGAIWAVMGFVSFREHSIGPPKR